MQQSLQLSIYQQCYCSAIWLAKWSEKLRQNCYSHTKARGFMPSLNINGKPEPNSNNGSLTKNKPNSNNGSLTRTNVLIAFVVLSYFPYDYSIANFFNCAFMNL